MLFIGTIIGLYYLLGFGWLFGILCVLLIIIMYFLMKILNTGETYKSYYNRTFLSLILNSFNKISFALNTSRQLK